MAYGDATYINLAHSELTRDMFEKKQKKKNGKIQLVNTVNHGKIYTRFSTPNKNNGAYCFPIYIHSRCAVRMNAHTRSLTNIHTYIYISIYLYLHITCVLMRIELLVFESENIMI